MHTYLIPYVAKNARTNKKVEAVFRIQTVSKEAAMDAFSDFYFQHPTLVQGMIKQIIEA